MENPATDKEKIVKNKTKPKRRRFSRFLFRLFFLAVIGGATWLTYSQKHKETKPEETVYYNQPALTATPHSSKFSSKTIQDSNYQISFQFPATWNPFTLTREATPKDHPENAGYLYSNGNVSSSEITKNQLKIVIASANYRRFLGDTLTESVTPDWTTAQLEAAQTFPNEILYLEKLSQKALLAARYNNYECSPNLNLKIYSPLVPPLPNMEINIPSPLSPKDLQILRQAQSEQKDSNPDSCNQKAAYQKLVDTWIKNGFPENIKSAIQTGQEIADSINTSKIGQ